MVPPIWLGDLASNASRLLGRPESAYSGLRHVIDGATDGGARRWRSFMSICNSHPY
jgi:hypothetical protein